MRPGIVSLGQADDDTSYFGLVQRAAQGIQEYTGVDLSSLGSTLADTAVVEAAQWATDKPVVRVNRARSAALVDGLYDLIDTFEKWRPTIFAVSGASCALAISMIAKRRKIPEGWVLYSVIALGTGTIAWFTRPYALRPAPAPLSSTVKTQDGEKTQDNQALAQFVGWIDRRVERNSNQRPGWEAGTFQRLSDDLGTGTMHPGVRTLLTRNSL